MVDELDARGIASEFIVDEPFHIAKPYTQCELCRQRGMTKPCRDCPDSLETTSFFQTIRETHEEVRASSRYVRDRNEHFPRGRGVLIISGRIVFNDDALYKIANARFFGWRKTSTLASGRS